MTRIAHQSGFDARDVGVVAPILQVIGNVAPAAPRRYYCRDVVARYAPEQPGQWHDVGVL